MSASAAQGSKDAKAGKSKLVPILLVVILLLVVGGGGAGFYLYKKAGQPHPVVVPPPVFMALDPFTVNMATDGDDGDGSDHYLHLGITLKIGSAEDENKIKEYLPEIRSRVLLLLSSKKPSDLATVAGKNKLSDELRTTVQSTFEHDAKTPKVSGVLLTDFVIQ